MIFKKKTIAYGNTTPNSDPLSDVIYLFGRLESHAYTM